MLQAVVLRLVVLDVLPDHRLITPHRGDEISASPKALADEISLPFSVHTRDVVALFPLIKPSRSSPSREPTLTHALSCADPAPAAAERSIGAIGRIERAVETGADINVALLLAELLT